MEYFLKVSTLLTAPHRNYVLIITLMIWIKYVLKEQLHSGNVPLKHLLSEKKTIGVLMEIYYQRNK